MAAVRRNIVESPADAAVFVDVVQALKQSSTGLRASELGIPGSALRDDVDLCRESGFAGEVTTGPFSPDNGFVVSIDQDPSTLAPRVTNHRLLRRVGQGGLLPSTAEMDQTLTNDVYDAEPFRAFSPGFRNDLEGWGTPGHNQVHVLVGGDMLLSTSPNDPIFFLNHCEMELAVGAGPVDRLSLIHI